MKIKADRLKRKDNKINVLEGELKVALQCERALVRMIIKTVTLMEVMGDRFIAALKEDEQPYWEAIKVDYKSILDAYTIPPTGVSDEQQSGEEPIEGLKLDQEQN